MPTGLLHVRLVGSPPVVELERDTHVPDDFWFSLPGRLAPGLNPSRSGCLTQVPIESLLSARRWLSDACTTYDVGLSFDERATTLLERAQQERRAVDGHLWHSAGPALDRVVVPPGVDPTTLTGSRFTRRLRSFQTRDLGKLLSLEHGANFSVPGAGKTAVAYAVYESERLAGRVDRLLIVAPLSAFEAWETEALRCFDAPPAICRFADRVPHGVEIVLVNYQRLHGYARQLGDWLLGGAGHLVLDEAHRMKRGRSGQWGSACLDLAHVAVRRDILTGTPAPQGPQDFIALVDFVWPEQASRILPAAALQTDPPDDAMADVSTAIKPLFVRTTKSELELERPLLHVEPVTMKPLQTDIYDALCNRYAGLFDLSRTDQSMLAAMGEVTMYLLEAATNPRLLARRAQGEDPVALRYPSLAIPPGSPLSTLIARYTDHELAPKFEKLALLVEQNAAAGRKTLVWSNFIGNLLDLERLLARHQPALIYGAIPSAAPDADLGVRTRESELDRFRNDDRCRVLLANPAAMAEGVSLHDVCHDAIYLERTFNAGQYLQSLDRIHRLGLEPGVDTRVTFLVSLGSIDETVDRRVGLKARRLGDMLDDPDLVTMALPDEDDYGEIIEDVADLRALFEHLEDAAG